MESIPLGTSTMWSLYTGGLYIQVIFIYRSNNMESIPLGTSTMWSLYTGGLYIQVQ